MAENALCRPDSSAAEGDNAIFIGSPLFLFVSHPKTSRPLRENPLPGKWAAATCCALPAVSFDAYRRCTSARAVSTSWGSHRRRSLATAPPPPGGGVAVNALAFKSCILGGEFHCSSWQGMAAAKPHHSSPASPPAPRRRQALWASNLRQSLHSSPAAWSRRARCVIHRLSSARRVSRFACSLRSASSNVVPMVQCGGPQAGVSSREKATPSSKTAQGGLFVS